METSMSLFDASFQRESKKERSTNEPRCIFEELANSSKIKPGSLTTPPTQQNFTKFGRGDFDPSNRSDGTNDFDEEDEDEDDDEDIRSLVEGASSVGSCPLDDEDDCEDREGLKAHDLNNIREAMDEEDETNSVVSRQSNESEKLDYLLKLDALRDKGYVTRDFTLRSKTLEMKKEVHRLERNINVKSSIKFQQKILVFVISMLEYGNKRFNPLDIDLEGWSENVFENIDDYETVFEKLYEKYKKRGEMSPEIELMLTVAGSAFMFNMSKQLFRSTSRSFDQMRQKVRSAYNNNAARKSSPQAPQQGSENRKDRPVQQTPTGTTGEDVRHRGALPSVPLESAFLTDRLLPVMPSGSLSALNLQTEVDRLRGTRSMDVHIPQTTPITVQENNNNKTNDRSEMSSSSADDDDDNDRFSVASSSTSIGSTVTNNKTTLPVKRTATHSNVSALPIASRNVAARGRTGAGRGRGRGANTGTNKGNTMVL